MIGANPDSRTIFLNGNIASIDLPILEIAVVESHLQHMDKRAG
jgi:hypothetical protein